MLQSTLKCTWHQGQSSWTLAHPFLSMLLHVAHLSHVGFCVPSCKFTLASGNTSVSHLCIHIQHTKKVTNVQAAWVWQTKSMQGSKKKPSISLKHFLEYTFCQYFAVHDHMPTELPEDQTIWFPDSVHVHS